jgi:hypothetical protein
MSSQTQNQNRIEIPRPLPRPQPEPARRVRPAVKVVIDFPGHVAHGDRGIVHIVCEDFALVRIERSGEYQVVPLTRLEYADTYPSPFVTRPVWDAVEG